MGIPYNIASYSLLLSAVAKHLRLIPRYFIHNIGDAHVYKNHEKQVREYLRMDEYPLPELVVGDDIMNVLLDADTEELAATESTLINYQHGPRIKAPIAV